MDDTPALDEFAPLPIEQVKKSLDESVEDQQIAEELDLNKNENLQFIHQYLQMTRKQRRTFCRKNKLDWKSMPQISKKMNAEY